MWKWFKEQSTSVKGMVILAILLAVGIIIRWEHVSREVAGAFGGLFERPQQEQTAPETNKGEL